MDRNRQNENLGVNKMGKNIRKSPIHQPNFGNNAARPQPQPQIYNISKNDFRNIVQQLTGSPSQDPQPPPRPPQNPPKPQSMRLQRIRPPPLTPINRPNMPAPIPGPVPMPAPQGLVNNNMPRPAQFAQPPPRQLPPLAPPPGGDSHWPNPAAESPISAYMRYLQNSMLNPSPVGNQAQLVPQPPFAGQMHPHQAPPTSGLLPNPNPPVPALPSPRLNGPPPMPNFPSPHWNGPALLPSPTSQFLLPSPTGYYNLLSPKSPYPLLSPGIQFSPPMTPNFAFPSMPQSGILGPGPHPPPSPGVMFPLSPSGFFPILSPRWRDQ